MGRGLYWCGVSPDGIGVGVSISVTLSCLHNILWTNDWLDSYQICIDIYLGYNKERIDLIFKVSAVEKLKIHGYGTPVFSENTGGGWVRQRCRISCVTGPSNWYRLSVGQGLLSLQQVRVEGECFYFFCFFTFIPVPLSPLFFSFISSTISSVSLLPFSGRWHKLTYKDWCVVNPNTVNQSENTVTSLL